MMNMRVKISSLSIWTAVLISTTLFASSQPKVIGSLECSDGNKPLSVNVKAYLLSQPEHVLTNNSREFTYNSETGKPINWKGGFERKL